VLVTPDNCNASYTGTAVYKAPPNLIKQEIYFAIQTFFWCGGNTAATAADVSRQRKKQNAAGLCGGWSSSAPLTQSRNPLAV